MLNCCFHLLDTFDIFYLIYIYWIYLNYDNTNFFLSDSFEDFFINVKVILHNTVNAQNILKNILIIQNT